MILAKDDKPEELEKEIKILELKKKKAELERQISTPEGEAKAQPEKKPFKENKSPGIAAVLSFIWPGAGQIYNGQIAKGIILLAVSVITFLLIFIAIGCCLYPIVWVFAIYDAYHEAEKINETNAA
jgi:TM2 domain-containing membrane protein YozV